MQQAAGQRKAVSWLTCCGRGAKTSWQGGQQRYIGVQHRGSRRCDGTLVWPASLRILTKVEARETVALTSEHGRDSRIVLMYTNRREDYYAATAAAGEALSRQFAQALVAQLRRTARGFGFAPTWRPVYLHFCVQFLRQRHAARQLAAASRCRHLLHSLPCCTLPHTVSELVSIAQGTALSVNIEALSGHSCHQATTTLDDRCTATRATSARVHAAAKSVNQLCTATTSSFLDVLPCRKSQTSDNVRLHDG